MQRRIQEFGLKGGRYGERFARAYIGGLGQSPQRGQGQSPLKLKDIHFSMPKRW